MASNSEIQSKRAITLTIRPPLRPNCSIFFKKWANPGFFYCLFSVFSNKHHYNFYKNMWKMSFKYTVPEFEPMTFETWYPSHYHQTRAPARVALYLPFYVWAKKVPDATFFCSILKLKPPMLLNLKFNPSSNDADDLIYFLAPLWSKK